MHSGGGPAGKQWGLSEASRGRWVFPARTDDAVNQVVDSVHCLDCNHVEPGAELLFSADTDFVACLDGRLVGRRQYSHYPDQKTYERLPIDGALRAGPNTLAVTVFCNGRDSSVYRRGEPGLVFDLGRETVARVRVRMVSLSFTSKAQSDVPASR